MVQSIEQAKDTIILDGEQVQKWLDLTGGKGFPQVFLLVQTLAQARRWPQITREIFLASMEVTFFSTPKPGQHLDLALVLEQKREKWYSLLITAKVLEDLVFHGEVRFVHSQNQREPTFHLQSSAGEEVADFILSREIMDLYLELSGDPNPIHRAEAIPAPLVYPGLLLLGQAEAAAKPAWDQMAAAGKPMKVKFRSPVLLTDLMSATVEAVDGRLDIVVSKRAAVSVSPGKTDRKKLESGG